MMKRLLYTLTLTLSILACTDEIDKSNRFTFTGETMADFLLNRSEKYSHFIKLLKRADLFSLLNTYGQYTLFLPDNEAIERFLVEQDSIYWATKDTDIPVWTGITSPLLEELSDSMANVIARTHLVETMHMMAEMGEGALLDRNFNYRLLGVNYVVRGEQYYIMLNNSAAIIGGDNQVENGVVHLVDKVIAPSLKNLPELISAYPYFGIFTAALHRTGFADSLKLENDDTYIPEQHTIPGNEEYMFGDTYAPATKFYKYTGFVEPDAVFRSHGIENVDDLAAFAEKWYGTEDRDNPRSPRNALNRFVSYHFVPREMPHNKIVPYGIYNEVFNLDDAMPVNYDRYDYFETMQGTMMKVMKPLSRPEGRDTYINFNKRLSPFNTDMHRHLSVRIIPLTEFIQMREEYARFDQMATNGIVHPIDRILVYNEDEMAGNILNERIRIDAASLLPELQCNAVRYTIYKIFNIPDIYSDKLKITSGYVSYVSQGHGVLSYNSDRIVLEENFDIEFTLPPLPARVYEVRHGMSSGERKGTQSVRLMQVYIDGKPEGSPYDICYNILGYVHDDATNDNGIENDKQMRNLGWMKGPVSVTYKNLTARNSDHMRKIITRKYFGPGRHKIRFRYLGESTGDLNSDYVHFDYIELVPLHIVNDPLKPEDRY